MNRVKLAIAVALLGAAMTVSAVAVAGGGSERIRTGLSGLEEVPAVITNGNGTFKARLSTSARTIQFELSYSGLEGGEVRQAHIHAGQMTANGGIVAWLCDSATNPAPADVNVDTCPPSGPVTVTVTGTITADDVQATAAVPTQGFRDNTDKFAKLVRALRAGVAYANVHTATSTGGEIRGQIDRRNDD